ncbi:polysaccharide deacetylase family protein [Streptomyces sp. CB03238]|uniref:polysaccharide deacetylase family protein n=1 Tax=Streptomyces sp. CB03238 TaxID=1907777 RepID=UPI001F4E8F61|nr:polysaccharide deacetylase family protein [Streptomyces sp. CB03238]
MKLPSKAAVVVAAVVLGTIVAPVGRAQVHRAAVATQRWDETRLRALFGSENRTIRTEQRVVALTFNAAWNDRGLDTVLAVLGRHKAPATFFLTGDFADRCPEAVRRITAAGYGLGNHSYSHPYFADLTASERASEVLTADRAIRAASGAVPLPFFRFPYGETTEQHIADVNDLGFADIEFTTDTNGYLGAAGGMTADKAVRRAVDALRPGAILQMHIGAPDGQGPVLDAEALPRIIEALESRGYRITDLRGLVSE